MYLYTFIMTESNEDYYDTAVGKAIRIYGATVNSTDSRDACHAPEHDYQDVYDNGEMQCTFCGDKHFGPSYKTHLSFPTWDDWEDWLVFDAQIIPPGDVAADADLFKVYHLDSFLCIPDGRTWLSDVGVRINPDGLVDFSLYPPHHPVDPAWYEDATIHNQVVKTVAELVSTHQELQRVISDVSSRGSDCQTHGELAMEGTCKCPRSTLVDTLGFTNPDFIASPFHPIR